ncbi:MAG: hypothetical protein FJ087_19995 [Deltaproteobacteria bacterium]|nr:hypothetical protein [Deltaproteobacteria bacterium]
MRRTDGSARGFALVACALALRSAGCGGGAGGSAEGVSADLPPEAAGEPGPDVAEHPAADPATEEGGGPSDTTPPRLLAAFSRDGKGVTARFSEPLDPAEAAQAASYSVRGSNGATVPVLSAVPDDRHVRLALDPGTPIDTALSYELWVAATLSDPAGNAMDPAARSAPIRGTVHLAIVWHQHQSWMLDAARDEMTSPWIRKHATRDFYGMAAMAADHPDMHMAIALTPPVTAQLQVYVDRIGPFVDRTANRVDAGAFLAKWKGHTDPWLDVLLLPTPDPSGTEAAPPTEREKDLYWAGPWRFLSVSAQTAAFFPEIEALRDKAHSQYTRDDLLALKVLFELAWFDPSFLDGPVALPDGGTVDLSDVVEKDATGRYTLAAPASEDLANRLVAESWEVMANVAAVHRALRYDPDARTGQIELVTTPYHHPLLPLLVSTDLAAASDPWSDLPDPPFAFPEDAVAQVARGIRHYADLHGAPPAGLWPPEGAVAEEVVGVVADAGLLWLASDERVLERSLAGRPGPSGSVSQAWRVDADRVQGDGGDASDDVAIVFRDTSLSNDIGFAYQGLEPEDSIERFLSSVAERAPGFGRPDRLVTVLLDGCCAWESYVHDLGARRFLHGLYAALSEARAAGEIVPVTVAEYLLGNPARGVAAHPVHDLPEIEPLWAGSWIGGDFSVWIGEPEENAWWSCLREARAALGQSGLPAPDPLAAAPADPASVEGLAWRAWDSIWAAEASDWFWWAGNDMMSIAADDTPFESMFRLHLATMVESANAALALLGKPAIPAIACAAPPAGPARPPSGPFDPPPVIDGQMLPGESEWTALGGKADDVEHGLLPPSMRDASGSAVPLDAFVPIVNPPPPGGNGIVFVTGNQDVLGQWTPNLVALRDDGEAGDANAGDRVWTGAFPIERGTEVRYKYTAGLPSDEGKWAGTEEFPLAERGVLLPADLPCNAVRVRDVFADRPSPSGAAGPATVVTICPAVPM